MKILFLINSLQRNGAERVAINLLSYLSEKIPQDKFSLYTLEDTDNPLPVQKQIEQIKGSMGNSSNFFKFLLLPIHAFRLKKIVKNKEIDTIISFLSRSNYVNILAKKLGSRHRCIISERNIPSMIYNTNKLSDIINRFLKRRLYPLSNSIIAISQGVKNDLSKKFKISTQKISVIYNPLNVQEIEKQSSENVTHKWLREKDCKIIITVGRLEKPKNQQLLIHAFKKVIDRLPQTRLILIGEGSLSAQLLELSENLKISEKMEFIGYQNNPFTYIAKADLFVLSSKTEGFGNVIPEAMVCGCPVISTDCPSGPGEIIRSGINGILVAVDDVEELSTAIISILQENEMREKIIINAQKRVADFKLSTIANKYYENLLSPLE